MIKLDLHIHSCASKYKESRNIVDDSTIENIDVLLSKLHDNDVALFSITDHNRFYADLYKKIDEKLSDKDNRYNNVKNILSGVEFDVILDPAMKKCHIITIFDTKNDPNNYDKIERAIEENKLIEREAFYTKENFEKLLSIIGLNTILIACQRKDIHNHSGNHNSLSDSSKKIEEIFRIGYINALEYQKPKVEGILRNNLKELPEPVGLVTGSDCHTWSCYPKHNNSITTSDFYHSKARILPSFKGLLMAITSPKTRINCRQNNNVSFFQGIKHESSEIEFQNGINAIIGENGSGKSTLLKYLNGETREAYIKKIIKINDFSLINKLDSSEMKYIHQGDIIEKFNKNTLFSSETENNFKNIDHSNFEKEYKTYSEKIKNRIEQKIKEKLIEEKLSSKTISYQPELDIKNYYIHVACPSNFDEFMNEHEIPRQEINKLLKKLKDILLEDYYNKYEKDMTSAIELLTKIYKDIDNEWKIIDIEAKVKNSIQSCISDYDIKINGESSARDKEKKDYQAKQQDLIDTVIDAIKISNAPQVEISEPKKLEGISKNTKRGFCFNREAKYNGISMIDDFFSIMFNKNYQDLDSLLKIQTKNELAGAIKSCTSFTDIDIKWNDNFDKFLKASKSEKEYITDSHEKKVGNTLGEMSLSYFKYSTKDTDNWNVLIIDQPEDNISNNNINNHLIEYFNSIRDTKQIIIVTHNPLLVVNLDVDNVIYVSNRNMTLETTCGCLEYENESYNMLDIIANNMDGGKESIAKRLKVYGE